MVISVLYLTAKKKRQYLQKRRQYLQYVCSKVAHGVPGKEFRTNDRRWLSEEFRADDDERLEVDGRVHFVSEYCLLL